MRHLVPEVAGPEWDYQFQPQYQSSDESEIEEVVRLEKSKRVVDPDSADEGIKRKPAEIITKRRVLVSHAPAWRPEPVSQMVRNLVVHSELIHSWNQTNELLDKVDRVSHAELLKNKTGRGNAYCPRRRGEARSYEDTSLPSLARCKETIYISREMINLDWLESDDGVAYDLRTLIACDLGSDDEGFNGLTGAGDEVEEEGPGGADVDEDGYQERDEVEEEHEERAAVGRRMMEEMEEVEYM